MAGRYNGVPLDDRSATAIMSDPRPQQRPPDFSDGSDTQDYVYYPGGAEVPEAVAVSVRTRSFSITAVVDFGVKAVPIKGKSKARLADIGPGRGVLFAHGGRFGGHALYLHVEDGVHKLCYVYNWLGMREQRVSCELPADPSGKMVLKVSFDKDEGMTAELDRDKVGGSVAGTVQLSTAQGDDPDAAEDVADQALHLGDGDTGSRVWVDMPDTVPWITQPGNFALTGEGLNVGRDGGHPVSHDYEHPGELKGAKLVKVVVTIKDDGAAADHDKLFRLGLWKD